MICGFMLLLVTVALKGKDASWPWTGFTTADNQHIGLYLILVLFPALGIIAIKMKMVKEDWNAPAALSAGMIGVLLILHDPKSHGFHKNLHVYTGFAWISAVLCRLRQQNMFVGFFSPVAGLLFCSVTFAHQLSNSLTNIDALGILFRRFYCCCNKHVRCLLVIFNQIPGKRKRERTTMPQKTLKFARGKADFTVP